MVASRLDFFFSTIPHLTPELLGRQRRTRRFGFLVKKEPDTETPFSARLKIVLGHCAFPPASLSKGKRGANVLSFLADMRSRLDGLSGPPELVARWEQARQGGRSDE